MKPLFLFLTAWLALAAARADVIGGAVEITPVSGWIQVAEPTPSPFPTARFDPKDGRNASVLITVIPSEVSKVSDLASLKKFHRVLQQPYLPSPDAQVAVIESKFAQGFAVHAVFEDPDLVGKPVRKGSFKVAVPVAVYLNGGPTLHVTIFVDAKDSVDFREALKLVLSASLHRVAAKLPTASDTGDRQLVALPGFGAALGLPARFQAMPKFNSDPGYFSFADDKHVNLSGWLDRPAGFKGMREFWAKEKAAMTEKAGIAVSDESLKIISGWNVMLYTARMKNMPDQKNVRACRVVDDTWADVHLSTVEPNATWKDLEDVVKSLSLAPK